MQNTVIEKARDPGGKLGTVAPGKTGLEKSCRLPKRERTRMTICTCKVQTLAPDAGIEDLMMQARKFKYDVIGLTETRRRHPLNAVYDTGEELLLGTCDTRGVVELWDEQGERLSEFIIVTKTIHGNSQFQKPPLYAGHGSRPRKGIIMKLTTSSSVKDFASQMTLLYQSFMRDRTIAFFEEDLLSHGEEKKSRS
ncbi:hypothetical protein RB195_002579 [Necator americanus]|uniref:Uncharacterized protein n=1 Tax=Necator americanus TaxID=51031 RepID=A0ABR1DKG2_NECAM